MAGYGIVFILSKMSSKYGRLQSAFGAGPMQLSDWLQQYFEADDWPIILRREFQELDEMFI